MGRRGTVSRKDMNRVGNGFAVGGTDIPYIYTIVSSFTLFPYFRQPTNIERVRGDCGAVVAHDDLREHVTTAERHLTGP